MSWPGEPLGSTLSATLSDLEMPRFCRRFPTLLNTVINQLVELISVSPPPPPPPPAARLDFPARISARTSPACMGHA